MMNYRSEWLSNCFSSKVVETATVYRLNHTEFATYSINTACEVCRDIKNAYAVDDQTGEILMEVVDGKITILSDEVK